MAKNMADLLAFLQSHNGIGDKAALTKITASEFDLTKDRSVYYCQSFSVRFSSSKSKAFSNTVLSLSNLRKHDNLPFIVCLVTPTKNMLFLANSTFLKKISHSSLSLTEKNIKGSFNGSDINRHFESIFNIPNNFDRLFDIHAEIGFEGNLTRLVAATNNIQPVGTKFRPNHRQLQNILAAPQRAIAFSCSANFAELKSGLDNRVYKFKNEIVLSSFIENVNIRGRIIEYLIAGEDETLHAEIVAHLNEKRQGIPVFKTSNDLGDYSREFAKFLTATDIKTKIMVLSSNPKAYNLDKMLEFLAHDKSVFLFYFLGIAPAKIVSSALISMFQTELLEATVLQRHWAGRNSRGVSQFEGRAINSLLTSPNSDIEQAQCGEFLSDILAL